MSSVGEDFLLPPPAHTPLMTPHPANFARCEKLQVVRWLPLAVWRPRRPIWMPSCISPRTCALFRAPREQRRTLSAQVSCCCCCCRATASQSLLSIQVANIGKQGKQRKHLDTSCLKHGLENTQMSHASGLAKENTHGHRLINVFLSTATTSSIWAYSLRSSWACTCITHPTSSLYGWVCSRLAPRPHSSTTT